MGAPWTPWPLANNTSCPGGPTLWLFQFSLSLSIFSYGMRFCDGSPRHGSWHGPIIYIEQLAGRHQWQHACMDRMQKCSVGDWWTSKLSVLHDAAVWSIYRLHAGLQHDGSIGFNSPPKASINRACIWFLTDRPLQLSVLICAGVPAVSQLISSSGFCFDPIH